MAESKKQDSVSVPLRSEVVQEIMGKVPHVLIRWGNTIILILAIAILVISFFIRYPIVLEAPIEITTLNSTENVYAPEKGILTEIMVKSGDTVRSGDVLARIIDDSSTGQILKTPTSGRAYTLSFLNPGRSVTQREVLFKIIPIGNDTYQAVMRLPTPTLQRIEQGQEVRLRLTDKVTEQKVVPGSIAEVSEIADEHGLVAVLVLLNDGLITTTGEELKYMPGMRAKAEIIIENPRLIEHFFSQLRTIFD